MTAPLAALALATALQSPTAPPLPEVPPTGVGMQVAGAFGVAGGPVGLLAAMNYSYQPPGLTVLYAGLGIGGLVGGSIAIHYGRKRWSYYKRWRALSHGRPSDPPPRRGQVMMGFGYSLLAPAGVMTGLGIWSLSDPPSGDDDPPSASEQEESSRINRQVGASAMGIGAGIAVAALPLIVFGHRRYKSYKGWKSRRGYAVAPSFGRTAMRTPTYGVVVGF